MKTYFVIRCVIWNHLHNLKNVKNIHGGVLLLVKLQAKSQKWVKSNPVKCRISVACLSDEMRNVRERSSCKTWNSPHFLGFLLIFQTIKTRTGFNCQILFLIMWQNVSEPASEKLSSNGKTSERKLGFKNWLQEKFQARLTEAVRSECPIRILG